VAPAQSAGEERQRGLPRENPRFYVGPAQSRGPAPPGAACRSPRRPGWP